MASSAPTTTHHHTATTARHRAPHHRSCPHDHDHDQKSRRPPQPPSPRSPVTGVPSVPVGGPPTDSPQAPGTTPRPLRLRTSTQLSDRRTGGSLPGQRHPGLRPGPGRRSQQPARGGGGVGRTAGGHRHRHPGPNRDTIGPGPGGQAATRLRSLAVAAYMGVGYVTPAAGPVNDQAHGNGTVSTPGGLTGSAATDALELFPAW